MKPCINFPKNTYSGKEQSPLRYGLSAEGYDINSAMEGYDKQVWVVEIKNNKKVWNKKDSILRITPEEPVIYSDNEIVKNNEIVEKTNKPKPTDYNIFVKYRLNNFKDVKFDFVRNEWQELKKKPEELKDIMDVAKKWFEENKDIVSKKTKK
jgi:hypothetical protein